MKLALSVLITLLLLFTASLSGQQAMLLLPPQDNAALQDAEAEQRRAGQPATFAVSLPVHLSPATDGKWHTDRQGRAVWTMLIRSEGAKSLNLGFSEYQLPPGAELYLTNDRNRYGPFTAADNADHETFWSPLLAGDELTVQLVMPDGNRQGAKLLIATVNHDFTGVENFLVNDCNVDVACGAIDGYPEIDKHRDVIRSVAAYTLNGRNQCTGFLVNNVNQDGRPLFLTANHCRITEENVASVIVYWNYQNSSCRPPDSPENGEEGDGSLEVFNQGARILARSSLSDFLLLELDDPVNPRANVFFAGWSAAAAPPSEGVFSVHHPKVREKRISISRKPTTYSDASGKQVSGKTNFIRVPSWDVGTTEGGSSGAPLFDLQGRIRGQLYGGMASCSVDGSDIFGFFNSSWTGGGTPQTRLSDWLDPCATGQLTLGGLEQSTLATRLAAEEYCLTRCAGDSATFTIDVGKAFAEDSPISVSTNAAIGYIAPSSARGGGSFSVTLASNTAATGSYPFTVTVGRGDDAYTLPLTLNLSAGTPAAPTLLQPANRATDSDPFPTFRWQTNSDDSHYDLQLSQTEDFSSLAASFTGLAADSLTLPYALAGDSRYYWRLRATGVCGPGAWSPAAVLTTAPITCIIAQSASLPVTIPTSDSVQAIATLEVTQPLTVASVEVSLGIKHSFLGDVKAALVSPAGTVIPLFDYLVGGACAATDLYATFSDDASVTAATFGQRCDNGAANNYRLAQPLSKLTALKGESAIGIWQLVVTDPIPLDGGEITTFSLQICAEGSDPRDLDLGISSDDITTCSNSGASALLTLGQDYPDDFNLRIEAGNLPLDNYTYTVDPDRRTVAVTFSAFTLVGQGRFPLSYVAIAADGTERRAVATLTVEPIPQPVVPDRAVIRPGDVTFHWPASRVADRYTLQVSSGEDFTQIDYSAVTERNQLYVPRDLLPETFSWRLVSENSCGRFPGPSRSLALDTASAVHQFALGSEISIFPNPTYGSITVTTDGLDASSLRADLYSTTGQRLRQWPELRGPRQQLVLGALPAGVYYLRIYGPSGGITEKVSLLR